MTTVATTPVMAPLREKWAAYLMVGFAAGVLSGLLGIGGAAILIPGMVELLKVPQHKAHGTSLLVMIPGAALAAVIYQRDIGLDWSLVAIYSAASIVGAIVGARTMVLIPAGRLKILFGGFLLFVAIRMLVPIGLSEEPYVFSLANPVQAAGHLVLGLFAGIASGLLGIGGGQLLIPGMVFFFHINQKLAQGISLAFIVPTALSGTLAHYERGNLLPKVGALLIPGALVGALVGAQAAQFLPSSTLKQIFGIFLIYAGVRMISPAFWGRAFRFATGRSRS